MFFFVYGAFYIVKVSELNHVLISLYWTQFKNHFLHKSATRGKTTVMTVVQRSRSFQRRPTVEEMEMMVNRYNSREILRQPGFGGHDPNIDVVRRLLCMLLEKHG